MTEAIRGGSRQRLLEAAAAQVVERPGAEISMRAVCEAAGVKMSTLYHWFGTRQGLLDAVAEHGFELYLAQKRTHESSGDPVEDIRDGWDAHVRFGIANPGYYTLMYGSIRPGHAPDVQSQPTQLLRSLTRRAADQGLLAVDPDQAAAHVLAANIGVTLRQIALAAPDPALSAAVREGVIAAITGTAGTSSPSLSAVDLRRVIENAAAHPQILGAPETQLLLHWLRTLAAAERDTAPSTPAPSNVDGTGSD